MVKTAVADDPEPRPQHFYIYPGSTGTNTLGYAIVYGSKQDPNMEMARELAKAYERGFKAGVRAEQGRSGRA